MKVTWAVDQELSEVQPYRLYVRPFSSAAGIGSSTLQSPPPVVNGQVTSASAGGVRLHSTTVALRSSSPSSYEVAPSMRS
ncbi:hypothetical protein ABZ137_02840 [Streptomyces bobili]|uniref:hypothetical protein n=1 Tax=Streptomyces bobili TaxID=67280 RepID=UPI0033B77C46